MAIAITIPFLNPVRFFAQTNGDFFYNLQKEWEYKAHYCQKYQIGDKPTFQILTPYGSPYNQISLVDTNGNTISTDTLWPLMAAYGGHLCTSSSPIPTVSEGVYYFKMSLTGINGNVIFWSEPIYIKTEHEDTILIEYGHDLNDFDCIFRGNNISTPPVPRFQIRVEGGLRNDGFTPGGKYTLFQDQDLSPVMLQSIPTNAYRFTFGDNRGIPNYLADKINRIFALSDVSIDGVDYMRNEGAKLEPIERDSLYPLCPWVMELALKENLYSELYDPAAVVGTDYDSDDYSNEYS